MFNSSSLSTKLPEGFLSLPFFRFKRLFVFVSFTKNFYLQTAVEFCQVLFFHLIIYLYFHLKLSSNYFFQLFAVYLLVFWYVWSPRQFCWLQHSMKLESYVTEIWYFPTAVLLCGSFCFHSNTVHCRGVFNFEPSHARITYLTIRNSYYRGFFFFFSTYHISWDRCSQKPQNLAGSSIHNLKKKHRNVANLPFVPKSMQSRRIGKKMKHWDAPSSSQYHVICGSTWPNHMR